MTEKKELYADGIGKIHFAGNMVRIDFMTLQPAAEGEPPVPQNSVRVIMPPQGFLSAFSSMEQLIGRLIEAGVLTKTEPAAQAKTAPAAAPVKAPQKSAPAPQKNGKKSKRK